MTKKESFLCFIRRFYLITFKFITIFCTVYDKQVILEKYQIFGKTQWSIRL